MVDASTQNTDIAAMLSNIETAMSTDVSIYQVSKSSEIKTNISYLLNIINQSSYSYVLNINEFIRNNVRDASFLKKSLIERIQANMGE